MSFRNSSLQLVTFSVHQHIYRNSHSSKMAVVFIENYLSKFLSHYTNHAFNRLSVIKQLMKRKSGLKIERKRAKNGFRP